MIDLHIHSVYSDGTSTLEEIVNMSKNKNIKILSLTDHDNVDGLYEINDLCKKNNIKFINGIELSTEYKGGEIHILGYFLNLEDKKFLNFLEEMKNYRENRNNIIIEKLNNIGIDISLDDVMENVKGNIVSRTHIGNILIAKGYVEDFKEAFNKYLKAGAEAYAPKTNLSPVDGVRILKENGALSFFAHPNLTNLNETEFLSLIKDMKEAGLDGIEARYSSFSMKNIEYYEKIAKTYNLMISAGSDFHGGNRPGVEIGDNYATKELEEKWNKLYEERKGI